MQKVLQISILCILVVVNSHPFDDTVNVKEIPNCECPKGEVVESVATFTPDELINCCGWEDISAGRNVSAQLRGRALTNNSLQTKEREFFKGFLYGVNYNYRDVDMVIPKERGEASMLTFMKPFSPGMWFTTAAIMIYTALVVWLLEQKINPRLYREMPILEVFTLIGSTVSTMSLSQNVRIDSRLARIVIAVWLLVMSIIVSSYTANLSSRLNAQKPNPTITMTVLHELLARNVTVGYLKYSSIQWYLRIELGNLKAYTTRKECAHALSEGPNRGGGAAVLMDPEDARRFISERRGFTIYHISLPGSPPAEEMPAKRLGVEDFLGLFVITGTVTTLAVITFFFNLLYSLGRDAIADTAEQGNDPQLEMLPRNDEPEEQSSVEGESESVQTMGISNISNPQENALIEPSSVNIPHIVDES